ncbi:Fic family protein [Sporosarcina sp. HYO08]|uniref:Fic family protein n=1 Tax=Sporosarcina sp. HYO08 TaxID=1759557 RepID=UPI000795F8D6|nr:Fic family protein [Sporosarcina sp. HYO08]KXH82099.1 cell filamentation protein Fic [Sporosarcina sp. HYO08]
MSKEYLDDILVRLAHHSSALEGNTITLPETISIILHNQVSSNRSVDLREIYEIKNHEQAFRYLVQEIEQDAPLHLQTIKEIHALLMDRLQYDRGQFKSVDNAILGADFMPASARETPLLMQQWVENLNYRLQAATTAQEKIVIIAEAHIVFERIHPFADGNGRTGRMLLNYSLLQHDFAPLIIHSKEKATYLRYLAEQDITGFSEFIELVLTEEQQRLQRFANKEKQQISPDSPGENSK